MIQIVLMTFPLLRQNNGQKVFTRRNIYLTSQLRRILGFHGQESMGELKTVYPVSNEGILQRLFVSQSDYQNPETMNNPPPKMGTSTGLSFWKKEKAPATGTAYLLKRDGTHEQQLARPPYRMGLTPI